MHLFLAKSTTKGVYDGVYKQLIRYSYHINIIISKYLEYN